MISNKTYSEIEQRAKFDLIRYAQCWEDPALNSIALDVNPTDNIVSISSGGDNTIALLLDNPKSVVGVDISPVQTALCELKKVAIEQMKYNDFVAFMGISHSTDRLKLYQSIRLNLSRFARMYFDNHTKIIKNGLLHYGKFEIYLNLFRTYILKFTQNDYTITRLLCCKSIEEQKDVYHHLWDNRKWRWLVKVFLSKAVMGRFGRDPAFFRYSKVDSVSEVILNQIEHGLTNLPVWTNYYLHYILTGNYSSKDCMPPYLMEKNYSKIKENLMKLTFVTDSVEGYLKKQPRGTVSKINFSNIFEYMSEKSMSEIFESLVEYCRSDLIVEYRTLVVPRICPRSYEYYFYNDINLGNKLNFIDRSFFYGSYVVLKRK